NCSGTTAGIAHRDASGTRPPSTRSPETEPPTQPLTRHPPKVTRQGRVTSRDTPSAAPARQCATVSPETPHPPESSVTGQTGGPPEPLTRSRRPPEKQHGWPRHGGSRGDPLRPHRWPC